MDPNDPNYDDQTLETVRLKVTEVSKKEEITDEELCVRLVLLRNSSIEINVLRYLITGRKDHYKEMLQLFRIKLDNYGRFKLLSDTKNLIHIFQRSSYHHEKLLSNYFVEAVSPFTYISC